MNASPTTSFSVFAIEPFPQVRPGDDLTYAGVDRADDQGTWLLPTDPDASARGLRDAIVDATGTKVAVVIADSDGRTDRRGATVISIGAAWHPRAGRNISSPAVRPSSRRRPSPT